MLKPKMNETVKQQTTIFFILCSSFLFSFKFIRTKMLPSPLPPVLAFVTSSLYGNVKAFYNILTFFCCQPFGTLHVGRRLPLASDHSNARGEGSVKCSGLTLSAPLSLLHKAQGLGAVEGSIFFPYMGKRPREHWKLVSRLPYNRLISWL